LIGGRFLAALADALEEEDNLQADVAAENHQGEKSAEKSGSSNTNEKKGN